VKVNLQLIDADSGAHLWAEQFDTPRADLLQTQDEIVTHLAHALQFQLPEAEVGPPQTKAHSKSRRRGFDSPVPRGRAESPRPIFNSAVC
jgi:hypothetical protein